LGASLKSKTKSKDKSMKIDHQEIHSSVLGFLELLKNENSANSIGSLEFALDKLALLYHYVGEIPDDEKEYPESSNRDYPEWREIITKRFPHFGFYNIPSTISENIGEAELHTGDAIDDLADIANELSDFVWRWKNNSENNALWHLRFSYEIHWGSHLRSLQMYLHAIKTES
jgi:hypothetical protein